MMQEVTCDALAAEPSYLQEFSRREGVGPSAKHEAVSRGICILDKPLQVGHIGLAWGH